MQTGEASTAPAAVVKAAVPAAVPTPAPVADGPEQDRATNRERTPPRGNRAKTIEQMSIEDLAGPRKRPKPRPKPVPRQRLEHEGLKGSDGISAIVPWASMSTAAPGHTAAEAQRLQEEASQIPTARSQCGGQVLATLQTGCLASSMVHMVLHTRWEV